MTVPGKAVLVAVAAMLLTVASGGAEPAKPDARDSSTVQSCIKSVGANLLRAERCIGIIADPCLKRPAAESTAGQVACADRELVVWDDILNETYRRLRDKLDDEQKAKAREMQRAWIRLRATAPAPSTGTISRAPWPRRWARSAAIEKPRAAPCSCSASSTTPRADEVAMTPVVEAHGARIPLLGLGTWDLRGRTCARLVEQALRLGYRHVDTAEMYDNEREVGEGLRASGVKRDEVFVTTKVWPSHFAPRELERAAKDSLVRLRLSEVDLLLLHWPNPQIPLAETLGALCKVKRDGLARHIGVSNFTVALIEEAVRLASEPLVCNQIEVHAFLDQSKVDRRLPQARHWRWSPTARSPAAG